MVKHIEFAESDPLVRQLIETYNQSELGDDEIGLKVAQAGAEVAFSDEPDEAIAKRLLVVAGFSQLALGEINLSAALSCTPDPDVDPLIHLALACLRTMGE